MGSKFNRLRRYLATPSGLLATCALVVAGIGTALALQNGVTRTAVATENRDSSRAVSYRNLVTLSNGGETIVVDRQTGAIRALDQDEKARLAQGLRQIINNTTDGLVEVRHEDGSVSMDLDGHFQNVMLARREADGSVSESCVNDLEAAADFFQIDPQLLGLTDLTLRNAARTTARTADR